MEVLKQYSALIFFTVLIYIYREDAPGSVCRSKEMCTAKKLFFSNCHSFYPKIKYCFKMLQHPVVALLQRLLDLLRCSGQHWRPG